MIRYCFGVSISLALCLFIFYGIALQHFQRIDITAIGKTPRKFYTLYKPKPIDPIKNVPQQKPVPKKLIRLLKSPNNRQQL